MVRGAEVTERQMRAKTLRDQGFSYRFIGEELNVTTGRARQLVLRADAASEKVTCRDTSACLSSRAQNCLKTAGYSGPVRRAEIDIDGLRAARTKSIKNLGKKTFVEIESWVNEGG